MRNPLDNAKNEFVSSQPQANRALARGFTLLEVLTVVGIIAVLVTLVVLGVGHMTTMGRQKQTQTVMENLKGLVQEKEIAGGLGEINGLFTQQLPLINFTPVPAPGDVRNAGGRAVIFKASLTPNAPPEPQNVMAVELMVMQKLLTVPANRQKLSNFTASQLLPTTSIPGNPPAGYNAPFVLDAWGNPMIYVPTGSSLDSVYLTGDDLTAGGTAKRIHAVSIRSPDGRGFWASAGPDGIFGRGPGANGILDTGATSGDDVPGGDDNLYSFQN